MCRQVLLKYRSRRLSKDISIELGSMGQSVAANLSRHVTVSDVPSIVCHLSLLDNEHSYI